MGIASSFGRRDRGSVVTSRRSHLQSLPAWRNAIDLFESRLLYCFTDAGDAVDLLSPTQAQSALMLSLQPAGMSGSSTGGAVTAMYGTTQLSTSATYTPSSAAPAPASSLLSAASSGYIPLAPTASPLWLSGYFAQTGTLDLQSAAADAPNPALGQAASLPRSIPVNAAGLPLLESRPNGEGVEIFLDFARDESGAGYHYGNFSLDADRTTYNANEEAVIYRAWRGVATYFAEFNVNVTTVLPPTGGADPNFAWLQLSNEFPGGAAYVNSLTKSGPTGRVNSDDVVNRVSGLIHELGHIFGLAHQSDWDVNGNLVNEYSNGDGYRNVPTIGIDYNGAPSSRWWFGRPNWNDGVNHIQDDVEVIRGTISYTLGGATGMRPDDFGDTLATAYPLGAGSQQLDAYTSYYNDADVFKITPTTAGNWNITATPYFGSHAQPKLELLDASGNIVAGRDDASMRNGPTNEQFLNIKLNAGTYYVRVTSSGDYDELGYYRFAATQLPDSFVSNDVGVPTSDGSVSYDPTSGVFTQSGGGTDIWNKNDQFRYTYETLTGDGSITARIDALDNIGPFTKAGVMIRQSLNGNSASAFLGLRPDGNLETAVRYTAAAQAANVNNIGGGNAVAGGAWVRLIRAGNVISFATSNDGSTWTTRGSAAITMTSPVLIGLATSAWDGRQEAYATFSNVSVTGNTTVAAPTYNALPAPATLTAAPATSTNNTSISLNWAAVAGASGYLIERSVNGVDFGTIATVGSGITSYTDATVWGAMRWFYRVSASNGTSVYSTPSPVASTVNRPNAPTLPPVTASYMTRGTTELDINFVDVQGETGYRVEASANGGTTWTTLATLAANETSRNLPGLQSGTAYNIRVTPFNAAGDGPALVFNAQTRLTSVSNFRFTSRTSSAVTLAWTAQSGATGYYIDRSTDGTNWGNVATLGAVSTWSDTHVVAGTEYYYRIFSFNAAQTSDASNVIFAAAPAPSLPSGWTNTDIGTVNGGTGAGGDAVATSGSAAWKVLSSGNDIFNFADSFNFTYRSLTAATSPNATLVARIATLENTNSSAKAGLVLRQSLDPNSKSVAIMINAAGGYGIDVRTRATAGAGTGYQQALPGAAAPYWLRLTRSGTSIVAAYSTNGTTWTTAATITNFALSGTFYLGLGATSASTTALNTSTFDNVSLVGAGLPSVQTPATASPTSVGGTTTSLSVLGASPDGESTLTYTWSVLGTPPAALSFSSNGTNDAKNSIATFTASGAYQLIVTITDAVGATVTSTVIVNVTVPSPTATVLSASEQFGVASHTLQYTFDRDVGTQDWASLIDIESNDATHSITPTGYTYDATSLTLTVALPASSSIADGDYVATLKPGTLLSGDDSIAIFSLAGDVNRDRSVNFSDLLILAKNYGSSSKTLLEGDLTGDGSVTFADLLLLAKNYNVTLPAAATEPAAASAARTRQRPVDIIE